MKVKAFQLCFLVILYALVSHGFVTELSLDKSTRIVLPRGTKQTFCLNEGISSRQWLLQAFFYQINVYVGVIGKTSEVLSWHAVRGKSDDDFHKNLDDGIQLLLGKSLESSYSDPSTIDGATVDLESSFFRDLVSACPSPLFSRDLQVCRLSFSPVARLCVSVSAPDKELSIYVLPKYELNIHRLFLFFFGLLFVYVADSLSKSGLFQVYILSQSSKKVMVIIFHSIHSVQHFSCRLGSCLFFSSSCIEVDHR